MRHIFLGPCFFALAGLLGLAGLGCADRADPAAEAAPAERKVEAVAWDTLFLLGGEVEDPLLELPRLIGAGEDGLYVFDYGDHRVKAFDREGRPRWTAGGAGQGPGEFSGATDLQLDVQGDVWVADGVAGRVVRLSRHGEVRDHIPFGTVHVTRALPEGDALRTLGISPDEFWVRVDLEGHRLASAGYPEAGGLAEADPMVRQGWLARSPSGALWGAAFPFGPPLLVYEGDELRCEGRLIESAPFPRGMPERIVPGETISVWAVDLDLSEDEVFVLPRGHTEHDRRVLDAYSADDCRYRRSVALPGLTQAIAYAEGIFYLYREDPAPMILAVRLAEE